MGGKGSKPAKVACDDQIAAGDARSVDQTAAGSVPRADQTVGGSAVAISAPPPPPAGGDEADDDIEEAFKRNMNAPALSNSSSAVRDEDDEFEGGADLKSGSSSRFGTSFSAMKDRASAGAAAAAAKAKKAGQVGAAAAKNAAKQASQVGQAASKAARDQTAAAMEHGKERIAQEKERRKRLARNLNKLEAALATMDSQAHAQARADLPRSFVDQRARPLSTHQLLGRVEDGDVKLLDADVIREGVLDKFMFMQDIEKQDAAGGVEHPNEKPETGL